ncbi:helix-turn-helix domain-containing protein [Mycolicibacterium llatzerense]|uniref:helix-turn-helix domain-containing protein n=1 Tax=Mycolicibacterium llatzerense TaxID=280871 RepID=UPI0008DEA672|nr:helix-turn-helix domain-containing protein [Mycolicibacterium llatzerense]
MTPQPFTHAVPNPGVRRDIALAVRDGIPVEQLAKEFGISVSTVRSYAKEWEGAQRRTAALTDDEVEMIRAGVRRGARKRYEREYTARVVAAVMGEE